jgi:hypothetical protein
MKRSVYLGEFALAALAGEGEKGSGTDPALVLASAIRLYLGEREFDRPGWPYPSFLSERGENLEAALELEIEEDLWRAFEAEAGRQGASVPQLTNHAALYYAAELNSGRLTQRVAEDLEGEGN